VFAHVCATVLNRSTSSSGNSASAAGVWLQSSRCEQSPTNSTRTPNSEGSVKDANSRRAVTASTPVRFGLVGEFVAILWLRFQPPYKHFQTISANAGVEPPIDAREWRWR